MDTRSIDWLHLIPSPQGIRTLNLPHSLHNLLQAHVDEDGDTIVGWNLDRSHFSVLQRASSVVLLRPHDVSADDIRKLGFSEVLEYRAYPSIQSPSLYIPTDTRWSASRSIDMVAANAVEHRFLHAMAKLNQLKGIGTRILLARREVSALETALHVQFNWNAVRFALYTGAISRKRKRTIAVLATDGSVIAYVKLANSLMAIEGIKREVDALEALSNLPSLESMVPRPLGHFGNEDEYAIVISTGPSGFGPNRFGRYHRVFLDLLRDATKTTCCFAESDMYRSLQTSLESVRQSLDPVFYDLLARSAERLVPHIDRLDIQLSAAHRDFGPWNTKQHDDGRLFVYDWEGMLYQATPLYDFINFHFLNAVSRLAKGSDVRNFIMRSCIRWNCGFPEDVLEVLLYIYVVDHSLRRVLTSFDVDDARSSTVIKMSSQILSSYMR